MMKPLECHFLQDVHCSAMHEVTEFQTHFRERLPTPAKLLKAPRCPGWVGAFLFTCPCPKACFSILESPLQFRIANFLLNLKSFPQGNLYKRENCRS